MVLQSGHLSGERALVMLIDSKREKPEAADIVALDAVGSNSVFYKLSIMVILMAIRTLVKFQRICEFSLMAGFAIYNHVFALELKSVLLWSNLLVP